MSEDTADKKRGGRKIIKILGFIVFVLGLLYYSMNVYVFYAFKGGPDNYSWLVDIAQGFATADNEYHGLPVDVTEENPLTCKSYSAGGRSKTLGFCVGLFNRARFWDCSWWRFEDCMVLEGEAYLLRRPDLLGRAIAAIHDPCRYTPTVEEIEKAIPPNDTSFRRQMMGWRYYFDCGGVPDDPARFEHRPKRVFVKLFDEQGDVVFNTEIRLKN